MRQMIAFKDAVPGSSLSCLREEGVGVGARTTGPRTGRIVAVWTAKPLGVNERRVWNLLDY